VILVDTSVWVDHFRRGLPRLSAALDGGAVLAHPWVTGELALGGLTQREDILELLAAIPQAILATPAELLTFIATERLFGVGIGYVDVQLLAATKLTPEAVLWTQDRRLRSAASRLGIAFPPPDEGAST
jgi:predicted nucleic acid-binding protein